MAAIVSNLKILGSGKRKSSCRRHDMSFTAARELPPKALKEDAALIWLVGCTKTAVKPLTSDRYARELVNEEDVSTEVAAVEGIADSRALASTFPFAVSGNP